MIRSRIAETIWAVLAFAASPSTPAPPSSPLAYRRYELHELVGLAERVVEGVVEEIGADAYRLRVDRVLYGAAPPVLELDRFTDWTCASRWSAYGAGQRVLLFLRGSAAMGAGNEGDMAVVRDGALVAYLVRGSREVERWCEEPVLASWVPLDEVETAIRSTRAAFRFEWPKERRACRIEQLASEAELERLRASSGFARTLVEGIERATGAPLREDGPAPEGLVFSAAESGVDDVHDRDDGAYWPRDLGARVAVFDAAKGGSPVGLLLSRRRTALALLGDRAAGPLARDWVGRPRPDDVDVPDFGVAAVGVGDLDGDGHAEVLVGEPGRGWHRADAHEAGLWLGRPGVGGPVDSRQLVSRESHPGLVDGCGFARSLARLGDLDGDGALELAVGRLEDVRHGPRTSLPIEPPNASVAVVTLVAGGIEARSTLPAAAFGASGPERGLTFASTLAGVGDVDGDGVPDLALGDPHDHEHGPYTGSAWIAFLGADSSLRDVARIDLGGVELPPGGELGASLAALGDVDGNGVPDLLVGGADDLYVVLLDRSGSALRVHRHRVASLLPGCYQVRDVAAASELTGLAAREVFVVGLFGSRRPHDSRVYAVAVCPDGTLAAR